MEKEKHVVVIYPHPDDESFGSAGTIIKLREQGIPVTYLCATNGSMGRNMGSPPFANRESMGKIREQELIDACKLLDCDMQLLGYQDKAVEFEDKQIVAKRLKGIIEEINPSLIITHHPFYGVHPDHNAIGAATIEALRMIKPADRPKLWVRAITTGYQNILGEPDYNYDVTDVFDAKMAAIAAHKSQADGIIGDMLRKAKNSEEVRKEAMDILGKEDYYIWEFTE